MCQVDGERCGVNHQLAFCFASYSTLLWGRKYLTLTGQKGQLPCSVQEGIVDGTTREFAPSTFTVEKVSRTLNDAVQRVL